MVRRAVLDRAAKKKGQSVNLGGRMKDEVSGGVNAEMGIQRTSHSAAGGAPVDSNAPNIQLQGEKKSTGRVASAKKKKLNSEAWGPLKGSLCESCSLTWGTDTGESR